MSVMTRKQTMMAAAKAAGLTKDESLALSSLSGFVLKLAAKILDLDAVVSKLPKTADGVSIAPGGFVWVLDDDDQLKRLEVRSVRIDEPAVFVGYTPDGDQDSFSSFNCYSTRKAAVAGANQSEQPK